MMNVRAILVALLVASSALPGVAAAQIKPPGSSASRAKQPTPTPAPKPPRKVLPRQDVDLTPNFTRGDAVQVHWRSGTTLAGSKVSSAADSLVGTARVEVLSVGSREFVFAWTWESLEYSPGSQRHDRRQEVLAAALAGVPMQVAVSRVGNTPALHRYNLWSDRVIAGLKSAVEARRPSLGQDADLERIAKDLSSALADAATAREVLLPQMTAFFAPLVGVIATNEQASRDADLPNPFGGPPFPARAAFAVLDLSSSAATVAWEVEVRPERVASIMDATVRRLQLAGGKRQKLPKVHSLSVRSEGEVTVAIGSTWPLEGRVSYSLVTPEGREITTAAWSVKPASTPAR